MNALIRLLFRICLFRNGPEDMPYAPPLLGVLLVFWLLVQMLSGALQLGLSLGQMLAVQALSMAILLGGSALILMFKELFARFLQTALALVGVDVLLSIFGLPLVILSRVAGTPLPFLDGLYLMLVCWHLAVQSFIFHRALRVSPFLGLGLAVGFLVLTLLAIGLWLPGIFDAAGG